MFDDILIKPVKNMMITFSKELGHHVKKVNKGARYTLVGFSDVELEMVNAAAKAVGAGRVNKLTDNRSTEADFVQKSSPVKGFKGYKRK